jgi:polysaccharide biosynthesis protein PslH
MNLRPRLLFVSPIVPATTGNGLAMRAGALLEALAADFEVYLLIIPLAGKADVTCDVLRPLCAEVCALHLPHPFLSMLLGRIRSSAVPREWLIATPAAVQAGFACYRDVAFAHIHIFRLYCQPFAQPYIDHPANRQARVHLDLDDVESATRDRLAAFLPSTAGHTRMEREARYCEKEERKHLPFYDRVYVCSEKDRDALMRERGLRNVAVVPNSVRMPDQRLGRTGDGPFSFLFIGNLHYFPNRDGLRYFTDEILPILRRLAPAPFHLRIVGAGPMWERRRYRRIPEYQFCGSLPEVRTAYAATDASLVPLRCGGGTRIKILESFAFGRPVVSTLAGAEGLGAESGRELLVATSSESFARHCANLMLDAKLGQTLSANASQWVCAHGSQVHLDHVLRTQTRAAPTDTVP